MLKGLVIGNVVSTKKQESLTGSKFLEVRIIENNTETDKYIVAVDSVGAGIGEEVLVVTGSSARVAVGDINSPVDAVVAGIIDKIQN